MDDLGGLQRAVAELQQEVAVIKDQRDVDRKTLEQMHAMLSVLCQKQGCDAFNIPGPAEKQQQNNEEQHGSPSNATKTQAGPLASLGQTHAAAEGQRKLRPTLVSDPESEFEQQLPKGP